MLQCLERWDEHFIPPTISKIKSSDQPLVGHQSDLLSEIKLIRSARSEIVPFQVRVVHTT